MPNTFFIGDHKYMFPHLRQKVIIWERKRGRRGGGDDDDEEEEEEEEDCAGQSVVINDDYDF